MIGDLFLAFYGVGSGGAIGNILVQMEQEGIFAYALPFLMIFAIINAILTKVRIFGENRAVNIILSLSVSLMALQFNFVSYFFAEIFPRMGVLLSIIVTAVILMGLFFDFESAPAKYVLGGLIAIGFIVIVLQSFDAFGWVFGGFGGTWWWSLQDNLGTIIVGALFIGSVVWMIKSGNNVHPKTK